MTVIEYIIATARADAPTSTPGLTKHSNITRAMAEEKVRRTRWKTLGWGDVVPDGEPARVHTQRGYIELRWRTAPYEITRCYEHRFVMGLPPDDMHVHHINCDRADNRPENLEVLPPKEHHLAHRVIDREEVAGMYRSGLSIASISRLIGKDSGHLSRVLAEAGVEIRGQKPNFVRDYPDGTIKYLIENHLTCTEAAELLSVSRSSVSRHAKRCGIKGKSGPRPPWKTDRARNVIKAWPHRI